MRTFSASSARERQPSSTDVIAGWPRGNWIAAAFSGTPWLRQIWSRRRARPSTSWPARA
jgi:hypothetical protein